MITSTPANLSQCESQVEGQRRRLTFALHIHSDTQPESQPIDVRVHFTPNLGKFLLWEGEHDEEPIYPEPVLELIGSLHHRAVLLVLGPPVSRI